MKASNMTSIFVEETRASLGLELRHAIERFLHIAGADLGD